MKYEKRILVKHSLASVIALGIMGITRFLYSAVVSRRFGVEELGLANASISKAFFIAIPLSFFAVALGKYASEFLGSGREDEVRSLALPSFLLPLAGLVLLPYSPYLALLSTFRAVQLTLRSFLYGIHRGEHYAYAILVAFVGFIVGLFLPDLFAPYLLFLGTVTVIAFAYLLRFGYLGKPDLSHLLLLASYSAYSFLGTLSGIFLVQGPYFMAEILGNAEVAGVVSAVLSTAFLLTYLPQVLQSAIMPLFSYKHGEGDESYVKELAEKTTVFLSFVTVSAVFVLMIVGRKLLELVFNFDVGPSFYIALMAVEVYIAYNPSIVALNSTAYVKTGTVISTLGALVALASWYVLIPGMGVEGVMVGLLMGYGAILVGTAINASRLLNVSPRIYAHLVVGLLLQSSVFVSSYALLPGFAAFLAYEWKTIKEIVGLIRPSRGREP